DLFFGGLREEFEPTAIDHESRPSKPFEMMRSLQMDDVMGPKLRKSQMWCMNDQPAIFGGEGDVRNRLEIRFVHRISHSQRNMTVGLCHPKGFVYVSRKTSQRLNQFVRNRTTSE